ncbi:Integrator complex subunit 3 [Apophysomyces ossiformis]|uniref:Integrator complex subunit 3 n=1 Tax=Apophysomyces ossiformis TaxID=679940 RepID=A0A8H7BK09_9FUNG|nr:Integrator complex subunit 3 [Apophysomyces ossiformis]
MFTKLHYFACHVRFHLIKPAVKEQMFWLIGELTSLNVQGIDNIYLCLLKQIKGGDVSHLNIILCEQMLKLLNTHRTWLDIYPRVITTAVYTFLRLIPDHRPAQLLALQEREVRFIVGLLREKWMTCCAIGRDLVRALHDVASITEIGLLWDDLLNAPQKLSPQFRGIESILKQTTPKEYLWSRLTPDIESKLLFILQNLTVGHYQRNLGWFLQRYLSAPESEPYFVDIIRFIVSGWYPSNQILQSDIVPRYVVIGSMLRAIKNNVVAANVKMALVYDWLFFTASDNIMFIEPAMLLMERSVERYPYITSIIIEFLRLSVNEYYPPMKDYMEQCVSCGMQIMLSKGVIRSLIPVYTCPSLDDVSRESMQSLFSKFLKQDKANIIPATPIALPSETAGEKPASTHDKSPTPAFANLARISKQDDSFDEETEHREITEVNQYVQHEDDDDVDRYLYGDAGRLAEAKEAAEPSSRGIYTEEDFSSTADKTTFAISATVPYETETVDDTNMKTVDMTQTIEISTDWESNGSSQFPVESITETGKDELEPPGAEIPMDWSEEEHEREQGQGVEQQQEEKEEEEEEEEEEWGVQTEDKQSEQSLERARSDQCYWIFGDALKTFQTACSVIANSAHDLGGEEYKTNIMAAKSSLKEILSIYLRMVILHINNHILPYQTTIRLSLQTRWYQILRRR